MTNSKSTKRALVSSTLAVFLCVAMLIGTTFAWFTNTASTSVNKIQAGTLDVALEMYENDKWVSAEGKPLNFVKAAGHESEEILWEPGCTYELPKLRIVNKGNLALKYEVIITGINGDAKLNEVIDWTIGDVANGEDQHLGVGADDEFTISGTMRKTASNAYQDLSIDGISITVVATQDTYENDSNNDQYDADAEYPTYVANGLPTSGDAAESYKADLSEVIDENVINGYRVDGGNYYTQNTLLTFADIYDSVLINDAEIECNTLVVLNKDNTIVLYDCNITIAEGGKLVVNNCGNYQQILFKNVTINGVAVTSDNVSSIISEYCTGNLMGMVY